MRPPRTFRIARPSGSSADNSCCSGEPGSSSTRPDAIRPGRSISRRMARAVTLLPHPLSPTTPSTRPARRSRLTPSNARIAPVSWTKSTTRSRTERAWLELFTGSAIGIRRIAYPVAEKVERQNDQDHRHRRAQQPRRAGQHLHVLGILQQDAPADRWWTQTEAKEAQRRLADDHDRQSEAGRGDDVAREGWQHVAQDDPHLPGAGQFSGNDKILFAQRQETPACDAREFSPA